MKAPHTAVNGFSVDSGVLQQALVATQPALAKEHGEKTLTLAAQMVASRFMLPLFFDKVSVDTMLAIWDILFDPSHPASGGGGGGGDGDGDGGGDGGGGENREGENGGKGREEGGTSTSTREAGSMTPLASMTPRSRPAAGGIVPDDTPPRAILASSSVSSGQGSMVLIYASLALFDAVAPQLRYMECEESDMVYSTACSAFRDVTPAQFKASFNTIMDTLPPCEVTRLRMEVKARLAAEWTGEGGGGEGGGDEEEAGAANSTKNEIVIVTEKLAGNGSGGVGEEGQEEPRSGGVVVSPRYDTPERTRGVAGTPERTRGVAGKDFSLVSPETPGTPETTLDTTDDDDTDGPAGQRLIALELDNNTPPTANGHSPTLVPLVEKTTTTLHSSHSHARGGADEEEGMIGGESCASDDDERPKWSFFDALWCSPTCCDSDPGEAAEYAHL